MVKLIEGLLVGLEILSQGTLADLQGALEGLGGPVLGGLEGFELLLEQTDSRALTRDLPAGGDVARDQPSQKRQHRQDQNNAHRDQDLQHK